MKHIIILVLLTLVTSVPAYAEADLEAIYKSFIPKASECYSAKLENPAAAACHASCDEAVVNLRMLVMGIPQPLSEEMKKQVAKCETDYAAFKGATNDEGVEEDAAPTGAEVIDAVEPEETANKAGDDPYAALKTELAGLEKACSDGAKSRHSNICVKFCKDAVSDLQKLNAGNANLIQMLKNANGDIEGLPSVRQCRLRHDLSTK